MERSRASPPHMPREDGLTLQTLQEPILLQLRGCSNPSARVSDRTCSAPVYTTRSPPRDARVASTDTPSVQRSTNNTTNVDARACSQGGWLVSTLCAGSTSSWTDGTLLSHPGHIQFESLPAGAAAAAAAEAAALRVSSPSPPSRRQASRWGIEPRMHRGSFRPRHSPWCTCTPVE